MGPGLHSAVQSDLQEQKKDTRQRVKTIWLSAMWKPGQVPSLPHLPLTGSLNSGRKVFGGWEQG